MFAALCEAMGRPELVDDPRFATTGARASNADELRAEISGWTAQLSKYEIAERLEAAGVPGGPVLDTAELMRDPHLVERGFVKTIEHPEHGEVPMLGWAPRLSASEVELEIAPALGAHTDQVLATDLGLDAEALADLHDRAIVEGD